MVVGGVAWAGLREPTKPAEPQPAPEAVLPPVERVLPAPVASQPKPLEPPVSPLAGEGAVRAPAKAKPRIENAYLTVASEPWGTLYLDNLEIGPTPVADYPLQPGKYRLRIEQEGYRTKTEILIVTGPNPIRRRYSLEPAGPE